MALEDLANQSGKWNQFELNEKKFGLASNFREDMYTTQLDMKNVSASLLEKASKIEAVFQLSELNLTFILRKFSTQLMIMVIGILERKEVFRDYEKRMKMKNLLIHLLSVLYNNF